MNRYLYCSHKLIQASMNLSRSDFQLALSEGALSRIEDLNWTSNLMLTMKSNIVWYQLKKMRDNYFLLFGANKLGSGASGKRQRRAPAAASASQSERVIMRAALISAIDKSPQPTWSCWIVFLYGSLIRLFYIFPGVMKLWKLPKYIFIQKAKNTTSLYYSIIIRHRHALR